MSWVVVTGGTGVIGRELVLSLLPRNERVRILSRDQSRQQAFEDELLAIGTPVSQFRFFVGDVRDRDRLKRAFNGAKSCFHLAAMKHVNSCEYNVDETVKSNVVGALNVVEAAACCGLERVVYSSSDKAAQPNSVMGISKLLAEKIIVNANWTAKTRFSAVRFGNVLWSAGSVLPCWRKQFPAQGTIWVTDPNMTRFLLTKRQAVELLLHAYDSAEGGETVIRDMPSAKLIDLANAFFDLQGGKLEHPVTFIGRRPGETLSEQLFTDEEAERTYYHDGHYYLLPPFVFGHRDYSRYKSMPMRPTAAMSDSGNVPLIGHAALVELLRESEAGRA